jgi:hypothetical protein
MERGSVGSSSSGVEAEVDEVVEALLVEKEGGARCGWAA